MILEQIYTDIPEEQRHIASFSSTMGCGKGRFEGETAPSAAKAVPAFNDLRTGRSPYPSEK